MKAKEMGLGTKIEEFVSLHVKVRDTVMVISGYNLAFIVLESDKVNKL